MDMVNVWKNLSASGNQSLNGSPICSTTACQTIDKNTLKNRKKLYSQAKVFQTNPCAISTVDIQK